MKTFTNLYILCLFLVTLLISPADCCVAAQAATRAGSAGTTQNETLVSIYPNPNKGIAKMRINTTLDSNSKVRISNTIGKVVKVVDLSAVTTGNEVAVDLTSLPAGIYFYSVLVNDKLLETKRLILEQ